MLASAVTTITGMVPEVTSVGLAVFGVLVAASLFKWARRAL